MTRIDRYLLFNFLRIFAISMFSLCGLFTIVHLFSNLDELLDLAGKEQSLFQVLIEFYGPRTLDFFDRMVGVLILVSGVFSLAMMQRRQELTAVEAAGVPRLRLLRPVLFAAVCLIALAAVNRELWIPRFRESLVGTAQNWKESASERAPYFHKDHVLGLLVSVAEVDAREATMKDLRIQIPIHISRRVSRISGQSARWVAATSEHPAGLFLEGVDEPATVATEADLEIGERPAILFPAGNPWLRGDQCFVATTLGLDELAFGRQLSDYTSLPEMIATLQRPSQWYSQSNRIAVHARIVRPLLDLSLLLVALPLVLTVTDRNLFFAAMICVAVTGLFSLVVVGSQVAGDYSLVRPAALAAWLPVIVFLPLSVLTSRLMLR